MLNVLPLRGEHVLDVMVESTLVAFAKYVAVAVGTPPDGATLTSAGHVMVGGTPDVMEMVNVHVAVLAALSVAEQPM